MRFTKSPLLWWLEPETPCLVQVMLRFLVLIRLLQWGTKLTMPESRPMPGIGSRCHELRIYDDDKTWRIIYRTDPSAVLVLEVFAKKSRTTPNKTIDACKSRLRKYDGDAKKKRKDDSHDNQ